MPFPTTTVDGMPHFTLNNGTKMPAVGLGCWMGSDGSPEEAEKMCKEALKCGYRHIDTAFSYGNEEVVGKAIRESGIPRSELFVTTKLWNEYHDRVQESFESSFKALNIDYIDLYLMHWPQAAIPGDWTRALPQDQSPTFVETWREMEKLLATGKVRAIGVSNFSILHLEKLLKETTVVPVTNQVQLHPCWPQEELQRWCEDRGILITAYSPFGRGNLHLLSDSDIVRVAEAHSAQVGQVSVSWIVQRGIAVVPKSANPERMRANKALLHLSQADMDAISGIHRKPGMHRSLINYPGGPGAVFGWTYKEMGWPLNEDSTVIEG